MPHHPHRETQSGETQSAKRKYRAEAAQRSLRLDAKGKRTTRSEARRVARVSAGKSNRNHAPARVDAVQTFTAYEQAAQLMLRLGVISVIGILVMLQFEPLKIALVALLKTLL